MRYAVAVLLLTSPALAADPVYTWRSHADDPDRMYLYRDGTEIGGWCYVAKHYRPYDGKEWGPPTAKAPVKPPANRLVITPPAAPVVVPQPIATPVPLRGPVRIRIATVMGQAIADTMMTMITDAIPRAIVDSVKKGDYKLEIRSSVTRSPGPVDGQTPPPNSAQPAQGPRR
jgi:hypothetical protein